MPLYNVHVFAEIRQKFEKVEAPTQRDACLAALKTEAFRTWMDQFKSTTDQLSPAGEFAEGFPGFTVDVCGDTEYAQTQFYFDTGDPYVELARALISWADDEKRSDSVLLAMIEKLRGDNLQTV